MKENNGANIKTFTFHVKTESKYLYTITTNKMARQRTHTKTLTTEPFKMLLTSVFVIIP